jgi:tetratricopeptide (TPR) repeat protein
MMAQNPTQKILNIYYQQMDERCQRLWRKLSLFPGFLDINAIVYIVHAETNQALIDETTQDLLKLRQYCLVETDGSPDCFRLHNAARDFGRNRISQLDQYEAQKRHASHFLKVLHNIDNLYKTGGEQRELAIDLFTSSWIEIRNSYTWCSGARESEVDRISLANQFFDAGRHILANQLSPEQRSTWFEIGKDAIRNANLSPSHTEAKVYEELGDDFKKYGKYPESIEQYKESLKYLTSENDLLLLEIVLGKLGGAYVKNAQNDLALDTYKRCLSIARIHGDSARIVLALLELGSTFVFCREKAQALACCEEALQTAKAIKSKELTDRAAAFINLINQKL